MYQDFKELLSLFTGHKVKYLVVGGHAVSFHAQPRATKDLDILIKADADNAMALFAALAKFGAPLWLSMGSFRQHMNMKSAAGGSPPVTEEAHPQDLEGVWV